ncbi:glycosyltransferase [Trinickia diaoshuihuensis]|uniref:glycosyltransferase n=1 Tax=Trinickia diaoshuihuensis TaxID=2292265 RepID=UPI0030B85E81
MKTSAESEPVASGPLHEAIDACAHRQSSAPFAGAQMHAVRPVVLIVEPDFTGHRWRYAQWAAQAYMEAGQCCVIATRPANAGHPLARAIAGERRPELHLAWVDDPAPANALASCADAIPYARHHRYFAHAYASVSARAPIAFALAPYLDYFLYALPFLGSPFGETPWAGITMRTTFHHRQVGVDTPARPLVNAIKAKLFARALRTSGLTTLLSIDPTLPQWSDRTRTDSARRASIAYLADAFPDTRAVDAATARTRLKLGPGPHVLVYGSITERKGIRELVAALQHMAHPPTLIVAGQQDEATRSFLRSHARGLAPKPLTIDDFIDSDMERDLFSACDVLWLGYKGHYGMSGVLVQAYRFGKPVIATCEGLIGWFCSGGALGPVLEDLSVPSIVSGLERAFARPCDAGETIATPGRCALLRQNTLGRFKRTLREAAHGCFRPANVDKDPRR